jgi:Domain of unknown function (DUF4440)
VKIESLGALRDLLPPLDVASILHGLVTVPAIAVPGRVVVPPLPAPPVIDRFLLEHSWMLGTALAVIALVVCVTLLQRQEIRKALAIGGILAASAAAVFVTGVMVETDREVISRQSRELIDAVARGDRSTVASLLANDAKLYFRLAGAARDRDQVLNAVDDYAERGRARVKEHAVLETQAHLDGPAVGRTQVRVRVNTDVGLNFSWWRLDWRRSGDRWLVTEIEALSVDFVDDPSGR